MPALSLGRRVGLPGLGRAYDFWEHRPGVGKHLLAAFVGTSHVGGMQFDRGRSPSTPCR